MLSRPGATPKPISQGAIRNLITALNCSLSASPLLHCFRFTSPFLPSFSPFSCLSPSRLLQLCIYLIMPSPLSSFLACCLPLIYTVLHLLVWDEKPAGAAAFMSVLVGGWIRGGGEEEDPSKCGSIVPTLCVGRKIKVHQLSLLY